MSYTPKGEALPFSLMIKSWTRTGSGSPLGRSVRPAFLKSPIFSFFFVVHRYGRLTIRLKLFDDRVDLLKLSVTIRMLAALACFGVRLQAETHLAQQASNNLITSQKYLKFQHQPMCVN